jgi:hypothetical protein
MKKKERHHFSLLGDCWHSLWQMKMCFLKMPLDPEVLLIQNDLSLISAFFFFKYVLLLLPVLLGLI